MNAPPDSTTIARSAHDLQESTPAHRLAIDAAGVTGVERSVTLVDGRSFIARIEASVALTDNRRGVHMSRFHEAIADAVSVACEEPSIDVAELAARVARGASERHGGARASARVTCRMPISSRTPATARPTESHVDVIGSAEVGTERRARAIGVHVTGINACPCAQELVRGDADAQLRAAGFDDAQREAIFAAIPVASHNQRAEATLTVHTRRSIEPATLVELCRASMSAPIEELLKRQDELHVVSHAHRNPKFVEDSVREMLSRASRELVLDPGDRIEARQVNFESIHAHDAWATAHVEIRD